MTNTSDDYYDYTQIPDLINYQLAFIAKSVLAPTFTYAGAVLNVLAFCIWMFGPKSKSLCCATYFTANSIADLLLLTIRPIFLNNWIINIPIRMTDVTCKLLWSLCDSLLQVSTWLSATITVERALTIILPFVFKSQDMNKRSKYIVAIIIVIQPLTQILTLMYVYVYPNVKICYVTSGEESIRAGLHLWLALVIPFLVIIAFNLATITALCRNRFRQNTVSGNRDHALVFTKITIMTGVSFVLSYSLKLVENMHWVLNAEIWVLWFVWELEKAMMYFNSCMNPIICLVVCRSMHDDIKSFLVAVVRRVRRPCTSRSSHLEAETANAFQMVNTV